jgi:hypothetical protein
MPRNLLKWQAVTCYLMSAVIALPLLFNNDLRQFAELRFMLLAYIITSVFFILAGTAFLVLYLRRKHGLAAEIDESFNLAGEIVEEDLYSNEYFIWCRPKWVMFVFFSWLVLFAVYFLSTVLKSRIVGGELLSEFGAYSIIMFATMLIGLWLYWRMDPNGPLILFGVIIFNIFRIIVQRRFLEILVWIYPIMSLFLVLKYFYYERQTPVKNEKQ